MLILAADTSLPLLSVALLRDDTLIVFLGDKLRLHRVRLLRRAHLRGRAEHDRAAHARAVREPELDVDRIAGWGHPAPGSAPRR